MRILPCFLLLGALAAPWARSQGDHDRKWIERLKGAKVSLLDPALPGQRFADWFSGITKSAPAHYEVNDCGERNGTPEERGKEFPLCVEVSADVGVRRVQLQFAVGRYTVPAGAEESREKAARVQLFGGQVGPSNPRMKSPTYSVRKLSDLNKLLGAGDR